MKHFSVPAMLLLVTGCLQQKETNTLPGKSVRMTDIPYTMSWISPHRDWQITDTTLTILAGEKTDMFIDPQGEYRVTNSPKLVFQPDQYFQLSARVKVDFATDYDAGVIVVYKSENSWAKFCFEYSPQHEPTMVSVVNNQVSDDCNHVEISGNEVFMRVSGLGKNVFAFHHSADGQKWSLARYFTLDDADDHTVGFSSQSPTGLSCSTVFSKLSYKNLKLEDLRNGS